MQRNYEFSDTNHVAQQKNLGSSKFNLSRAKIAQHAPPEPNVFLSTSISALYSSLSCAPAIPRLCPPFFAFRLCFKSSDDVASTRRWRISSPIRPNVNLFVLIKLWWHNNIVMTNPENTPPARTRQMLTMRWYQNSSEPGSAPGWPVLCFFMAW